MWKTVFNLARGSAGLSTIRRAALDADAEEIRRHLVAESPKEGKRTMK